MCAFCMSCLKVFLFQALQSLLEVLVQGYGCEFSQRDIQRMELIVMQKLDFKLTNYTPHDFLKMVGLQLYTHTFPVVN